MGRGADNAKVKYLLTYGMTGNDLRRTLYRRQRGVCPECEEPLPKEYIGSRHVNIDHIWPQSHGGPSETWNVQLLHSGCNHRKASRCTYPKCPKCQEV